MALALTLNAAKEEMHLEALLCLEGPKKREDEEMEREEEREWEGEKERDGDEGMVSLEEGVVKEWREEDEESERVAILSVETASSS